MREEASPINSDAGTAVLLSRKFDALVEGSNDSVHERMPQDPDAGFSVFMADEKMSSSVEPVVVKTRKRRSKSVDASIKAPRRRSLRIQRRKSLCDEGGEIPSIDHLDDNNAAEMNGSQSKEVADECQMKVTHDGSSALAQTVADVVMDLVSSVSSADQDEPPATTTTTPLVDDEDTEGDTTRNRKKANVKSVLESLEHVEKENSLNSDKVVKLSSNRRKRRDTFELSRRRGLTRTGAAQCSDDGMEQDSAYATSTGMEIQIDTDEIADLKPPAAIISAADKADETWTDMITPKNGSNEVHLPNNFANEISSSLANEPDEIRGSAAVKENLRNVTSVAIEEKMRSVFSEFSVYNYVSSFLSTCQTICYCICAH